ncbi:MAG: hypothetical protein JKY15_07715 [Deltaproteobacteria bacterium]|nr:hypothetical protein [Deltaproteobacteria bacterium]
MKSIILAASLLLAFQAAANEDATHYLRLSKAGTIALELGGAAYNAVAALYSITAREDIAGASDLLIASTVTFGASSLLFLLSPFFGYLSTKAELITIALTLPTGLAGLIMVAVTLGKQYNEPAISPVNSTDSDNGPKNAKLKIALSLGTGGIFLMAILIAIVNKLQYLSQIRVHSEADNPTPEMGAGDSAI